MQVYVCICSTCQQYTAKNKLLTEKYVLSVFVVVGFPNDAKSGNIFIMFRKSFFRMFWAE